VKKCKKAVSFDGIQPPNEKAVKPLRPFLSFLIPIFALVGFAAESLILETCTNEPLSVSEEPVIFSLYRSIPGVTENEIAAVEEFKKQGKPFIYGMIPSTESFLNSEGEVRGYSALMCEWLTELFGIEFISERYSWFGLLDGLKDGSIHFTGDLTANEERRKTYIMTDAIAQRSIRYFRIAGRPSLSEISQTRLPRYLLQEQTTIAADVQYYAAGTFEPIFIHEYNEVYELLKSGKADALITEGVQEAFFDDYSDIIALDFFPLIYSPVSLSTENPALAPFISIVQKALDSGAIRHLNDLYDDGYREYLKQKLFLRLTEEEREFIKENPVIPYGIEYDNYPISFFSVHTGEWQGICVDVLKRIEAYTGFKFEIANDEHTNFPKLLNMLETGEISLLSELIPTIDRQGRFLWAAHPLVTERSVLISRIDYPNVNVNRVYSERVGLSRGTAHTEFFTRWFPNHPNSIEYESQSMAFDALMHGDVDMVMCGYTALLYLTNYLELAGFKANIMFDNNFVSTFGINFNEGVLCSIIDKALELVDTKTISEQWRYRTYDYRLKVEQARTPWLIGSIVLSLLVLALVIILFLRSNFIGKELEQLIQKRTHELALQTATLTTLFDSIPDLIFTKNLKFNFLHCNKAFLEHFNKSIDDVVGIGDGKDMGMTSEEAEKFNDTDRRVIRERQVIKVEEYIPRFDGTRPFYETIKMPLILDGDVIGIMGIARDITQRKEMEAAALAASQSKSAFLANMSHEIRTPMNAILGVTEILIQNETLPLDIEEGLGKIYSSCGLLLGIINDILDFSKIEAGKLDIMPAHYSVASLINDSVQLNVMRVESKPIEFELNVDENVPVKLIGDELRIKQILNNLLSNAFKYTDQGKVTLSVATQSIPMRGKIILEFKVRDTGHGMTQDQLGKMFDEYSRFLTGKNISIEGTGLGLAITQRLVSLMDGEIHVDSEIEKGSLFTVRLPQDIVDSETLGKDVAENLRKFRMGYLTQRKNGRVIRDSMPYGNVLIVDDVETNLYVAVGLMKLYRLQIDTAMNGHDAIEIIKSGKVYDVIFMDHMMPEMDGIETAKHIRDFGYTAPIVALTANAVLGQADIFLNNGFDEFISKPIDIRQLDTILIKHVRDKQPPEIIKEARRQQANGSNEMNGVDSQTDTLLLESFIRDAGKAIALFEDQIANNAFEDSEKSAENLKKFTIAVHGIKSSLWNVGERKLADFALKLEESGRKPDVEFVKKSAPDFISELRVLLEKFDIKNNKYGADDDIIDLRGKLYLIIEKASGYDRKGALDIIAEIKNPSRETKAVLDDVKGFIIHSEFEKAESAAAAYAAELTIMEKK